MNKIINEIPLIIVDNIVIRALEEDIATGDITSEACIDPNSTSTAYAVARQPLIVCGNAIAAYVFEKVDPTLNFKELSQEGSTIKKGDRLWKISGNTRSILLGERVALNLVQRMSGIATLTRQFVDKIPKGSHTRIADTRKTTPGLRALERYAVRVGGGYNHRDNLGSAIMIKDNHIAASTSISKAIARVKNYAPHTSKIECEVETLDQLKEAIDAGAHVILLDNMDLKTIEKAVKVANGKVILEASGGVTLEKVEPLVKAGVDIISVGALTHSAPSADIGLDF